MQIVSFEERHVAPAAALERLCFSAPWSEDALRAVLHDPNAWFVAAEEDGAFLGYAGMHCPMGDCYVDNVAVVPAARRRGVGEALVRALLGRARQVGTFLSLEVRPSNTAARTLYAKLGFLQEGVRKNYYVRPSEDALILTCRWGGKQKNLEDM